jgi:hypothetical protein
MKQNITIQQGSNFDMLVRWESPNVVFKPITAVTKAAPPVVTATGHGMPDGWRCAFTNIVGMTQLNAVNSPPDSTTDFSQITLLSADTFSVVGVDATGFTAYKSGGIVRYYAPVDLTGYTARMQIRPTVASATILQLMLSSDGHINIDTTKHTIDCVLTAAETAAFTFSSAVYSLEMVSVAGAVTEILHGTVKLTKETTR